MSIVIIKYNAGNIQSVLYALERLGVTATVTDNMEAIQAYYKHDETILLLSHSVMPWVDTVEKINTLKANAALKDTAISKINDVSNNAAEAKKVIKEAIKEAKAVNYPKNVKFKINPFGFCIDRLLV